MIKWLIIIAFILNIGLQCDSAANKRNGKGGKGGKGKQTLEDKVDADSNIDTLGVVGDKTYCIGKEELKWPEALDFCHSNGMGLATIITDDEQSCVQAGMIEKDIPCLWLSATDMGEEKDWRWMEGYKKIQFDNWERGESKKANLNKNCAYIETSGKWFTTSCSKDKNIPLCERKNEDDEK